MGIVNNQFIKDLEKKLGPLPENFGDYEKEGDNYADNGQYDEAAAVYNHASRVAPANHPIHKKRMDALEKSLKQD